MATKKQKRQAALAKRERWLEERRQAGLKAQKDDHEHRRNKKRLMQREEHDKNHSKTGGSPVKDCVLCEDLLIEARRAQKTMEQALRVDA